jgi:hypothetical protein
MLQPVIAFFEEGFNLGRRASVTLLGLISAMGSFVVVYFSKDLIALDTMDFWVGQVLIFILGTVTVIMFGWVMGVERGFEEAHRGAHMRIPKVFKFIIRYISPAFLISIFALFVHTNIIRDYKKEGSYVYNLLNNTETQITMTFIAVLAVFFTLMIQQAGKRWRTEEKGRTKEVG